MKHLFILILSAFLTLSSASLRANTSAEKPFEAKDYTHLLGMPGFSDDLLIMHFKLYQGYVKTTNLIQARLKELSSQTEIKGPEYSGLKRMFGWEFDGMRLHEYYFENLGGKKGLKNSNALSQRFNQDFGSFEEWKKDFTATGMMRGIGWVVLYVEPRDNKLINAWISEHDLGHLAGAEPLLVMDVFEHAYMPQYGLDRSQYIEAFFQNVDWDLVSNRYKNAVK